MRDSWIDKDEFDELVEAFSPSKKGRKRVSRARAPKRNRSKETDKETSQAPPPPPKEERVEEIDPLAISSIDLIDDYANSEIFSVNDEGGEVAEWDVAQVEILEEEPELVIEEVSEEKTEISPERGVRFLAGDDIEIAGEEPFAVGGSVADAVKAVKALADARDKVDRGGLLRRQKEPQSEPVEVADIPEQIEEPVTIEDPVEIEELIEDVASSPVEVGEEETVSFVDDLESEELFASIPVHSSAEKEADFSREGTIHRRLTKFAGLLSEKLNATDVLIMDGEGFPLFEESNGDSPARLEKSGSPHRLVHNLRGIVSAAGLEDRVSTQVSLGNGQWLCLLYSAEANDEGPLVRAVIPGALEGGQLQKWSNLLGAALLLDKNHGNPLGPTD